VRKINIGAIAALPAATAGALDRLTACQCGCEESELGSKCHPGSGLRSFYDRKEKVIILLCGKCQGFCAKIKVAPGSAAAATVTHGGAHVSGSPSIN